MTNYLLCPFCGNVAAKVEPAGTISWQVMCLKCGARGPTHEAGEGASQLWCNVIPASSTSNKPQVWSESPSNPPVPIDRTIEELRNVCSHYRGSDGSTTCSVRIGLLRRLADYFEGTSNKPEDGWLMVTNELAKRLRENRSFLDTVHARQKELDSTLKLEMVERAKLAERVEKMESEWSEAFDEWKRAFAQWEFENIDTTHDHEEEQDG